MWIETVEQIEIRPFMYIVYSESKAPIKPQFSC